MIITHKIKMDLCHPGNTPRVDVVQDDCYTRELVLELFEGSSPWSPGKDAAVMVTYGKSDGTEGRYDTLPDGTTAWHIADNVVTVALAPQVCTAAGRVQLAVNLLRNRAQISTFPIELNVSHRPGRLAASEDYFNVIGILASTGWAPDMYLGTDANGNVVAVEAPESSSGLPMPASAQVGQYFRVKSVDENGQVTAVEAVDLENAAPDAGDEELISDPHLYNGMKLPALPDEWDREAYPYAVITALPSLPSRYLYCFKEVQYVEKNGGVCIKANRGEYQSWTFYANTNSTNFTPDWRPVSTDPDYVTIGVTDPVWSNFAVLDLEGNVVEEPSDPVSLAELNRVNKLHSVFPTIRLTTPHDIYGTEFQLNAFDSAAFDIISADRRPCQILFDEGLAMGNEPGLALMGLLCAFTTLGEIYGYAGGDGSSSGGVIHYPEGKWCCAYAR